MSMGSTVNNVITDLRIRNNFISFAIMKDGIIKTSLIRIGNSRGIVIPSRILKKYGGKEIDTVYLEDSEEGLSLRFSKPEEPYTLPFTGPFSALAPYRDEEAWGGAEVDALDVARALYESRVNTREIPEW